MKSTTTNSSPLEAFIRLEKPIKELIQALKAYDENLESKTEDLFILNYEDILYVLQRYIIGDLNADDVFEWASELEMRDDVQFGQEGQHVFHVIFKLSTPELEGPLTSQKAENLIKVLTTNLPTDDDFNKAYE